MSKRREDMVQDGNTNRFSRRSFVTGATVAAGAAPSSAAAASSAAQVANPSARGVALSEPGSLALRLPAKFHPARFVNSLTPEKNQRFVFADLEGPGCIRMMWFAPGRPEPMIGRKLILRIYWDGETSPSIEAPVGDFFGVCHGLGYYPINSHYLSVKELAGYSCYFPMPFSKSARIEIETGSEDQKQFHFHINWHRYAAGSLQEDRRFHAAFRREFPCQSFGEEYTVLDAVGRGQLVGFVYGVRLYDDSDRWSHAGAENIYIDGEAIAEDGAEACVIKGGGGEDVFGTSHGGSVHTPETHLYTGMPYYVDEDTGGLPRPSPRMAGYRFYVHEAMPFERSVHFRFGCLANDICSTAYWYQTEPHRPFVKMPSWDKLAPGTELTRGSIDLLRQTGSADPAAPLADAQDGEWWLCGPFEYDSAGMSGVLPPEQGAAPDPAARYDGGFKAESPWRDTKLGFADQHQARWLRRHSFHGFVDFTHVFRPKTKGTATNWPATACAVADLHVDRDTSAKLYLAWDDQMILRLNGEAAIDLGTQSDFRKKAVDVRLRRGANRLVLKLSNTKGGTWGAWCFAFRCVFPGGGVVVPRV